MLEWIRIKNLALIENAEVGFKTGFNVITGETGAGKTVLIEAIGMLLGERAEKGAVRAGASSCEISAGIKISEKIQADILKILKDAGLPLCEDSRLFLKRVITFSSTRNFVNDSSATLQTLKALGDILIDTHGPHEHQSLLKQSIQLELLDKYAGLNKLTDNCAGFYSELESLRERREKLEKNLPSALEAEHLRFVVSEIEKAAPSPNEDEELNVRHKLAANAHDILETSSAVVRMINDSEGCLTDKIAEICRMLQSFEKMDAESGGKFFRQCETLAELSNELADGIARRTANIELDEKEFTELELRLQVIQSLKRRYGPALEDVLKSAENARKRLREMENFDEIRSKYDAEEKKLKSELEKICAELTAKRRENAAKLAGKVCAELKKLGFFRSDFGVRFSQVEQGPSGADKIDFMFCANPGEKEQPLREIASSGEISRVMLALKTVLAAADSVPILVFDEIDVNIGGGTASIVGGELKKLGSSHQVLCISHLAQVAACADAHFKVDKSVSRGRTFTKINGLSVAERKEEIARMLGGGKAALKHAKELTAGN